MSSSVSMAYRVVPLILSLVFAGCASAPLSSSQPPTKEAVRLYRLCVMEQGYRFIQNKVDPSESLAKAAASRCTSELSQVHAALMTENSGKDYAEVYAGSFTRSLQESAVGNVASSLMAARSVGQ